MAERSSLSPESRHVIEVLAGLVEPLGRALPASVEVVLHDLSRIPTSIVAVSGEVTGRRAGDPPTNVLLEQMARGADQTLLNYESQLPDGRRLRSSTMIVKDRKGAPIAALCINTDVSAWTTILQVAWGMVGGGSRLGPPAAGGQPTVVGLRPVEDEEAVPVEDQPGAAVAEGLPARAPASSELFARSVDELAEHLITEAISAVGIPVELMKKQHKVAVVADLQARGLLLLKDAVEMIAEALGVSRFTVYNYLNAIGAAEELPPAR